MSESVVTVPIDAALLSRLIGPDRHLYDGRCPDAVEGWDSRDPGCPHCRDLIRAQEVAEGRPAGELLAVTRRAAAERLWALRAKARKK